MRRQAGLTHDQLWLRCFALGGSIQPLELEAVMLGALVPDQQTWNVVALALNERFDELRLPQRVPYDDLAP